jgi:hypothetical protein
VGASSHLRGCRFGPGTSGWRKVRGIIRTMHTTAGFVRLCLTVACVTATLRICAEPRPPKFSDYPAPTAFEGKPVAPKIVTPLQRRYRTRIREGVERGWGVDRDGGSDTLGPNFAGDMIVIRWGCGAPCLMVVMVNARTGEIYNPPLANLRRSHCRFRLSAFRCPAIPNSSFGKTAD